jgi:hypothetical protein
VDPVDWVAGRHLRAAGGDGKRSRATARAEADEEAASQRHQDQDDGGGYRPHRRPTLLGPGLAKGARQDEIRPFRRAVEERFDRDLLEPKAEGLELVEFFPAPGATGQVFTDPALLVHVERIETVRPQEVVRVLLITPTPFHRTRSKP